MPDRFNLLAELAQFSAERGIPVRDPQTVDLFVDHVRKTASDAVASGIRLHGHRVGAMFEALLLSLDKYCLLKVEDAGRFHPKGRFKVPDLRVVLADGSQWLIEVKNVYDKQAKSKKRRLMKRTYREKLQAYASATGGELKLAIYWARWGVWTLVSPEKLVDTDGTVTLDMATAMTVNELSLLGDVTIGTRPPLKLFITYDPKATGRVAPSIARTQIYCGDNEIISPVEQQIAWIFIRYGNWPALRQPLMTGKHTNAVEWLWEPEERVNEAHGLEIIGNASELFARYYADRTLKDGEVVQIQAPSQPRWFAPLLMRDCKSETLPLWHFVILPNFDDSTS